MLVVISLIIIAACVAAMFAEGLWTNLVTFFNVVTAALLATNLFEWLANSIDGGKGSGWSVYWDALCLWGLFAVFMALFRAATDFVSRVRVRFIRPVDVAGGVLMAAWTGWVLVCFTVTSLHVAPLARTAMWGSFMETPDDKPLGVAPDRQWLGFVHRLSLSSLSGGGAFDPDGDFIYKYADRRADDEAAVEVKKSK